MHGGTSVQSHSRLSCCLSNAHEALIVPSPLRPVSFGIGRWLIDPVHWAFCACVRSHTDKAKLCNPQK